jgi:hypothetical protein
MRMVVTGENKVKLRTDRSTDVIRSTSLCDCFQAHFIETTRRNFVVPSIFMLWNSTLSSDPTNSKESPIDSLRGKLLI